MAPLLAQHADHLKLRPVLDQFIISTDIFAADDDCIRRLERSISIGPEAGGYVAPIIALAHPALRRET